MQKFNEPESISLNKFISSTGMCSRRMADKWIIDNRVTLNGKIAIKGNRVFPGDVVKVDGKPLRPKPKEIYLAFNKPVDIICTTDLRERKNIITYINHKERLFPIGRLDRLSEGLIFLTNNGDIVNKILRAGNNHEKEYLVTVDKPLDDKFEENMRNRVPIMGTYTKQCKVQKLSSKKFKIVLTQGLNRQIRRMCEYFGYEVQTLKRIRIMNVKLGELPLGEYRNLSKEEMETINKLLAQSSKTEEASK